MESINEEKRAIADVSEANLDDWVRLKSFTHEVEEVFTLRFHSISVHVITPLADDDFVRLYLRIS